MRKCGQTLSESRCYFIEITHEKCYNEVRKARQKEGGAGHPVFTRSRAPKVFGFFLFGCFSDILILRKRKETSMKYKEWLHDWLELYEKESVKPRTYRHYQNIICKRLIPALGEYEMEELTAVVLQKYIVELSQSGNEKTGKGLSPNTVNGIVIVLRSSLMMAYGLGFTTEIHIDKIRRPKTSEKLVESFTTDEQKRIEKAVLSDKRDKMFGVVLCLYTGLRIGELLALEWSDIDLVKGELSVNKTCYDGRDENGKTCRIVDTPKTKSSKRVIPLAKQLIPMLKERKKRSQSKYVVGSENAPISVRSYQRSFELLLKKLNIPHHGFHALRHTFATRAIECGTDVKSLSEMLGHKNPTITLNRYVHSFMEHKRDFVNRMGKML